MTKDAKTIQIINNLVTENFGQGRGRGQTCKFFYHYSLITIMARLLLHQQTSQHEAKYSIRYRNSSEKKQKSTAAFRI